MLIIIITIGGVKRKINIFIFIKGNISKFGLEIYLKSNIFNKALVIIKFLLKGFTLK